MAAVLLQQSPHSIEMRRVPSSLPVQGGDPRRITTMELLHNTEDMHNSIITIIYMYLTCQCKNVLRLGVWSSQCNKGRW